MTDQSRRGWIAQVVTSLITSLAVLAGAYLSFQGDVGTSQYVAEASRLESAFKRIEHLENQMRQQQANSNAKIIELTGQVFRLQSELNKDLNIMDMFERFMDSLPFEAWLKEVTYEDGSPVFEMLLINRAYEFAHGVNRRRYKGAEDSDIWGEEVAKQFREADLGVLWNKASVTTEETYPIYPKSPDSDVATRVIVKVYLELVSGSPMIFGMAIDKPK